MEYRLKEIFILTAIFDRNYSNVLSSELEKHALYIYTVEIEFNLKLNYILTI